MRRSLARTLVLGCLIARVAGMVRNAPKLTPPVPLQPLQQFQRLQPLEQAAIPAIAINPVYKPTVKDRAKAVFNEYLLLLERKPFTTKAVSAAVVGGIGDIVSQSLTAVTSRIHFKWDLTRTITFMLIGLLYRGPIMHVWLNTLERFGQKMTPRLTCPMKRSLAILAIDQTLGVAFFYPLFYVVHEVFSSFMSLQGTQGRFSCAERAEKTTLTSLVNLVSPLPTLQY